MRARVCVCPAGTPTPTPLYLCPAEQLCLQVDAEAEGDGARDHGQPGEQPQALGQTHAPLQRELYLQEGHGSLQRGRGRGAGEGALSGDQPSTELQVSTKGCCCCCWRLEAKQVEILMGSE